MFLLNVIDQFPDIGDFRWIRHAVFDWYPSYMHRYVVVHLMRRQMTTSLYTQTDKYIYLCNPIHLVVYLYV